MLRLPTTAAGTRITEASDFAINQDDGPPPVVFGVAGASFAMNNSFAGPCLRLLIAGLALVVSPGHSQAEPSRPTDDSTELVQLSRPQVEKNRAFRASQAALAQDRNNLVLAVDIARQAIEQGRSNADPRLYGQAQAALAAWWDQPDPPPQVRVLRAVIRQAYHEFPSALADLDAILAANGEDAQARLSRAFVRLVTGDVAGAADDCGRLPAAVGEVVREVCKSRVAAVSGSASQAVDSLAAALATDRRPQAAMRRFAYAVLADISLAEGRADAAETYFASASEGGSPDVSLLAAHADSLLDRGDPRAALGLLDGKGEADVLVLRRAIAAKRLGDPRLAEWAGIMNERFAAAASGGVSLHLREEARFRLEVENDVSAALDLAAANWQVQREPADARLLLESALAADDTEAARPVLDFIRDTGLSDARLAPLLARIGSPG